MRTPKIYEHRFEIAICLFVQKRERENKLNKHSRHSIGELPKQSPGTVAQSDHVWRFEILWIYLDEK